MLLICTKCNRYSVTEGNRDTMLVNRETVFDLKEDPNYANFVTQGMSKGLCICTKVIKIGEALCQINHNALRIEPNNEIVKMTMDAEMDEDKNIQLSFKTLNKFGGGYVRIFHEDILEVCELMKKLYELTKDYDNNNGNINFSINWDKVCAHRYKINKNRQSPMCIARKQIQGLDTILKNWKSVIDEYLDS